MHFASYLPSFLPWILESVHLNQEPLALHFISLSHCAWTSVDVRRWPFYPRIIIPDSTSSFSKWKISIWYHWFLFQPGSNLCRACVSVPTGNVEWFYDHLCICGKHWWLMMMTFWQIYRLEGQKGQRLKRVIGVKWFNRVKGVKGVKGV